MQKNIPSFNIQMLTHAFCIIIWHILFTSWLSAVQVSLDNALWIQKGTLPIILTAPHGGYAIVENAQIRKKGTLISDLKTFEIVEKLNEYLFQSLSQKPYIVAACVRRKYIDFNRCKKEAFENESLEPIYNQYHDSIVAFVQEIKKNYENGILLDIHGQKANPTIIFCGTKDTDTISYLIKNYGISAYNGEQSLAGYLKEGGYNMHPQIENELVKEDARFDGGYTVQTYGSHNNNGIDAIQLEIGSSMREDANLNTFCAHLGLAIVKFYNAYINDV